jgi:Cd2+/Zn2+-exporting ATPase
MNTHLKQSLVARNRLPFRAVQPSDPDEHPLDRQRRGGPPELWKRELWLSIACIAFGIAGLLLHDRFLFVLAYVAGGWYAAIRAGKRLWKGGVDVHFLMLAVAAGSAAIGAWHEGAMLLFLFSFSGAVEQYALGRTEREISSLLKTAPKTAILLDAENGDDREIPVEEVRSGMRLLTKPGMQFSVDAEIAKGRTAADESNLTGESAPVEKSPGDKVYAGTLNLWGAVETVAVRPASESALCRIIQLIHEAKRLKAPTQRFADVVSARYTVAVLAGSLAMFFVWWRALGLPAWISTPGVHSAFYRTMTLLTVASPCALVLSIPSAVLAAIAWGARHGILFRGGAAVEKLARTEVVALDKTGTLTTGSLTVEKVESFPSGREDEIGQTAFSLEKISDHPLARAVTRFGKGLGWAQMPIEDFESITGQGVRGVCGGQLATIGRKAFVLGENPGPLLAGMEPAKPGISEVWVRRGDLIGRLILRDELRPEARQLLEHIRAIGLQSVVLTGDKAASAEYLKKNLNVDSVRAELRPEDKVEAIRDYRKRGLRVVMIGDGVNDAPSLAAADVGIAMGVRGSDAALEEAEIVLMNDRLEGFIDAYQLSRRARSVIQQNVAIAIGMVVVLVVTALSGAIPLTLGVLGHEGSTVIVVLNSLRLLRSPRQSLTTR